MPLFRIGIEMILRNNIKNNGWKELNEASKELNEAFLKEIDYFKLAQSMLKYIEGSYK